MIKFHDFPGLKIEIHKFHDFPGFFKTCTNCPILRTISNTLLVKV